MNEYKIVYLAAGNASINEYAIDYNDYIIKRDLFCDMMDVDLSKYDVIIATPPCNYYSRANCNINSEYSTKTKHLLPDILKKLYKLNKPFIVENVINKRRMESIIQDNFINKCYYIEYGRHCYFTNIPFYYLDIPQIQDFKYGGYLISGKQNRQGGCNVNSVIKRFLDNVYKVQ